jgi:hypothetical protein
MWLHGLANRVPDGFTTRVQQHISHLILADLLNNGQKDSRLEGYLIEALEAAYERHGCKPIEHQRFSTLIEPLVADALSQYRMTRAAFAAFSGVIFDPVQAAVGLHRRRLHKLMDHLQRDVTISSQSSFRPKDQFVARILDMFDMIKSGLL